MPMINYSITRLLNYKFSGQLPSQQLSDLRCGNANADVKRAEQGIDGADLVEAHLVNQLLEDQRIVGEQVHAPLPIVESDRAGDDLLHSSCVAAADHAV